MTSSVELHVSEGMVEITFRAIPEVQDLRALRDAILRHHRAQHAPLSILAVIDEGGLGALAPDARRYFLDEWRTLTGAIGAAAVVIAGDSLHASLTRSFLRMLAMALGHAWTMHETPSAAREALLRKRTVAREVERR